MEKRVIHIYIIFNSMLSNVAGQNLKQWKVLVCFESQMNRINLPSLTNGRTL